MPDEGRTRSDRKPGSLLDRPLRIVNVGLERFAKDLEAQHIEVQHVDWAPPAGGDAKLADLLSKLGS
jgi:hypothetical protein